MTSRQNYKRYKKHLDKIACKATPQVAADPTPAHAKLEGLYQDYKLYQNVVFGTFPHDGVPTEQQKGLNPMRDYDYDCECDNCFPSNALPLDAQKLNFLRGRLQSAYSSKLKDLRKEFFMDEEDAPKTAKELLARIAAGEYVVQKDDFEKEVPVWSTPIKFFEWRKQPADDAGFAAADKLLDAAYQTAKDAIEIKSSEDGLAAIVTLEAWTSKSK